MTKPAWRGVILAEAAQLERGAWHPDPVTTNDYAVLRTMRAAADRLRAVADAACTEIERLRAERDAAEGRVLPPAWRAADGGFDREVGDRPDLIYVRAARGLRVGVQVQSPDGTWRDEAHWTPPFALIVRRSDPVPEQITADTVLAAIEAAEAWLIENPAP